MSNLSNYCGICGESVKERGYKTYGCELCPTWLHAKCIFPNATEAKLKTLFEFHSSFDVKCQDCKQRQKVILNNLVTKEDFQKFSNNVEEKITAISAISKEYGEKN